MPEPHHLAVPNALKIVVGIAILVSGILIVSNKVQDDTCTGGNVGTSGDHDDVNQFSLIGGVCGILGGSFAMLAGCLGCCGSNHQFQRSFARDGPRRQHRLIVGAAVMIIFGLLITLGSMVVIGLGYEAAHNICEDSVCSGSLCKNGCTTTQAINANGIYPDGCKVYCKDDYEAFCDYATKSRIGFVIALVAVVIMIVGCILNLCATCCCRNRFNMREIPPKDEEPKVEVGMNQK